MFCTILILLAERYEPHNIKINFMFSSKKKFAYLLLGGVYNWNPQINNAKSRANPFWNVRAAASAEI